MQRSSGSTLAEAAVVTAVMGIALLIVVPLAGRAREAGRTAAAARNLALTLQALRWKSVAQARGHGLWFQEAEDGWIWFEVQDGNGNGLRTAELRRGVDRVLGGPYRPAQTHRAIRMGFPGDGPFPRIPPRRGNLSNLDDPIQFGRSNLIGFSPIGRASSGTLYLTDGKSTLFGVVLFGPSARVRVWRYDGSVRRWTL